MSELRPGDITQEKIPPWEPDPRILAEYNREKLEQAVREQEEAKLRVDQAWKHAEKAMINDQIRWDRDREYWGAWQRGNKAQRRSLTLANAANVILAVSSIIGAVCAILGVKRRP
jgi:hypothetical protein